MLDVYEQRFPGLPWREPLPLRIMSDRRVWIGCRLCIARWGLKAVDIAKTPYCFTSEGGFRHHLATVHGEPE